MERITQAYDRNKKWLYFAIFAAFVWGMMAHGYAFFDNRVAHDSLQEFSSAVVGNDIKITSGRILTPVYRELFRGHITLTWLIGILSLLWLGIATYFIVRIFDVKSRLTVFLIAGFLTTNISVTATAATYIHDLDCYMFAVMCATGAVFLWRRYPRRGELAGSVLTAVTLGIYQANLFVVVTLAMMACILDLLKGETFRSVFRKGLKAIGMILIGGGIYYLILQAALKITGYTLHTNSYNTLDSLLLLSMDTLPQLVLDAYRQYARYLWEGNSAHPRILVRLAITVMVLQGLVTVGIGLVKKRMGTWERVLCTALILLLPLGMDMIYVLVSGVVHHLMVYPIWLTFVLLLLLSDWLAEEGAGRFALWQRALCLLLSGILCYGAGMYANGLYMKKDLEVDAYFSLMTRVLDRMETYDGYESGETQVVFVGLPEKEKALNTVTPGFEEYRNMTGMGDSDVIAFRYQSRYQAYFDYVLGNPVRLAEEWIWYEVNQSDYVDDMPSFPSKGCVTMIDGVMIVKLGPALKWDED